VLGGGARKVPQSRKTSTQLPENQARVKIAHSARHLTYHDGKTPKKKGHPTEDEESVERTENAWERGRIYRITFRRNKREVKIKTQSKNNLDTFPTLCEVR